MCLRYPVMKAFILSLFLTLCHCEDACVIQITERCYWSGIQKYTIFSDGKIAIVSEIEYGNGEAFSKSGTINKFRIDQYLKLFKAVGYFDISNESLLADRRASQSQISVSDGVNVTINIWDGQGFHEVNGSSIEIVAKHYADGPSYAKLLNTRYLINLLIDEISPPTNLP
jgi:hypothetical protein